MIRVIIMLFSLSMGVIIIRNLQQIKPQFFQIHSVSIRSSRLCVMVRLPAGDLKRLFIHVRTFKRVLCNESIACYCLKGYYLDAHSFDVSIIAGVVVMQLLSVIIALGGI